MANDCSASSALWTGQHGLRLIGMYQPWLGRCAQVYLAALEHAYLRATGMHGPQQYAALDAFGELGRSVAQAHTGFAAGAGAALSEIVQGGVAFALQARHSSQGAAQPVLACLHSPVH